MQQRETLHCREITRKDTELLIEIQPRRRPLVFFVTIHLDSAGPRSFSESTAGKKEILDNEIWRRHIEPRQRGLIVIGLVPGIQ
jgi:hypothetical protein